MSCNKCPKLLLLEVTLNCSFKEMILDEKGDDSLVFSVNASESFPYLNVLLVRPLRIVSNLGKLRLT